MQNDKKRQAPTPSTLKRLFSLCGNQCALPECKEAIVNENGTVIGRVCHIIGAEDDGPRGDAELTPEQRREFANLILLCANCHIKIDEEEETYTVEVLRKFKAEHESRFSSIGKKLAISYLEEVRDEAETTNDSLPDNLAGLTEFMDNEEIFHLLDDDAPEKIATYVEKLKCLTKNDRQLMAAIIRKCFQLDGSCSSESGVGAHPDDLKTILVDGRPLSYNRMNKLGQSLERNKLGSLDHDGMDTTLFISSPSDIDWWAINEYLMAKGETLEALLVDLNFALLG